MKVVNYFRAAYPIIYLQTVEESRAEADILRQFFEANSKNLPDFYLWSHTDGLSKLKVNTDQKGPVNTDKADPKTQDPIVALDTIKNSKQNNIFVFRDLHKFFQSPKVLRLLRDIANTFRISHNMLILISPTVSLPPEIEKCITILEYELPTQAELKQVLDGLKAGQPKISKLIDEDEEERVVSAAAGLSTLEAENAISKAIIDSLNGSNEKQLNISEIVLKEKALAVKKTGLLEYFEAVEGTEDVGGLRHLKNWISKRGKAYTKEAKAFHLPIPKGIFLVGLPGCGKSLVSKACSKILKVPIIRFDIGRVFGGIIGQSESQMRQALGTVDAIGNCILWIDEMDKGFAGMSSSHEGDNGVSKRVFGQFITWMQERKSQSFIIATINRIEGLPDELLRKGRVDEIFFVGLPDELERADIFKIHIKRLGRDPKKFDPLHLAKHSDNFSGAEIAAACESALYDAFYENAELNDKYIIGSIQSTVPLAVSRKDTLKKMKEWAVTNATNASTGGKGENAIIGGDRSISL